MINGQGNLGKLEARIWGGKRSRTGKLDTLAGREWSDRGPGEFGDLERLT